jgi:hypothetical protein
MAAVPTVLLLPRLIHFVFCQCHVCRVNHARQQLDLVNWHGQSFDRTPLTVPHGALRPEFAGSSPVEEQQQPIWPWLHHASMVVRVTRELAKRQVGL